MPATTLYFAGRRTARPGAQTLVDASALEVPTLGASGIIALVGEAVGGRPYNAVDVKDPATTFQRATSTGQSGAWFREGDLRELAPALFKPSNDPAIPAGAAQIVFVKTNPSAPSAATFDNADGNALTLTSLDYGLFTTQIRVAIADAAAAGAPAKDVTITFEDQVETYVDLGADAKFTLQYDNGFLAGRATRATADALASAFEINMERDDLGQDDLVTTQATGGASLEIISTDGGDTTQTVTVYGLNGSGVPQSQVATLNGTSAVAVPGTWNLETAVVLSAAAAGTVTVRNAAGAIVVFDVPPATLSEGRVVLDIPVEDGAVPGLTVEADGASTQQVVYRGTSQANQPIAEVLTLNGTTPVAFVGLWSHIESVEVADVEVARTLTAKGRMVNAPHASIPNLQRLKDKVEGVSSDFVLASLIGAPKDFLLEDLDVATATDVKAVATGSFWARLYDIEVAINDTSQLVLATQASPGTGAPDNTAGAVFLAGGHEGDPTPGNEGVPTSSVTDVQAAIDLLKQVKPVNTLMVASTDAAVHAIADAHCAFMGGAGKDERDWLGGSAAGETKAQLIARALGLNSRHGRLMGQEVMRFNTAGERVWQSPVYAAALVAGAQAGSPVGTPITNKQLASLGFRQDSSWNPEDDANEMILSGVCILRDSPAGVTLERNVTTHLSTDNLAYTEASVNEAVNYATKNLREALEAAVGRKGFPGTVNGAKGIAEGALNLLENPLDPVIVSHRNLKITLVLDSLEVEVEIAPVLPINFVPITVHLVTVPQTA